MPRGQPAPTVPVVAGGLRLTPPRRPGDCSCTFCSSFRSGHLIWRAIGVSIFVPIAFAVTFKVWNDLEARPIQGSGSSVGMLLIITTMLTFLAICMWYQPARRLLHRRAPRTTAWPPA